MRALEALGMGPRGGRGQVGHRSLLLALSLRRWASRESAVPVCDGIVLPFDFAHLSTPLSACHLAIGRPLGTTVGARFLTPRLRAHLLKPSERLSRAHLECEERKLPSRTPFQGVHLLDGGQDLRRGERKAALSGRLRPQLNQPAPRLAVLLEHMVA